MSSILSASAEHQDAPSRLARRRPKGAAAATLIASDHAVALDAGAIAVMSVLICVASDQLLLMTIVTPVVILARTALWAWLHRSWRGLRVELVFLGLCTLLGGFNDWNSVVGHGIYDYAVPHYAPGFSTIPIWMLIYWGLILRVFVTVGTWHRIGLSAPRDEIRLGRRRLRSPRFKVALLLVMVLATRQLVYRFYLDPIGSWVPFAVAGLVYVYLFGLRRGERRLALLVAVVGPLIEVLYIQVAGLHVYHLGWLGGVPLWIALWWVIAVWVWCDLGQRVRLALAHR